MHRRVWSTAAVGVVAVGLALSLLGTALGMLLVVLVTFSCVAVVIAFGIADEYPRAVRPILMAGPSVAAALFVVEGLSRWLGGWGVALVGLLALTSPQVLELVLRRGVPSPPVRGATDSLHPRTFAEPVTSPLPAEDFTVSDAVEELDLCRAWCSSFVALQRADTVQSRLRSVQVRALYLDELERRDAGALLAWLHTVPRPGADPTQFFGARPGRQP